MFYHWRSEALRQYGSGWIIVSGDDVAAARIAARAAAEAHFWEGQHWTSRDRDDEDDREEFAKFIALIDTDIGAEPEHSASLFIFGSE